MFSFVNFSVVSSAIDKGILYLVFLNYNKNDRNSHQGDKFERSSGHNCGGMCCCAGWGSEPGLDKTLREALGTYDTYPQGVLNYVQRTRLSRRRMISLYRRHTGILRKRDDLLTERVWGRSQIIQQRKSLVLYKLFNTLCPPPHQPPSPSPQGQ